MIARVYERGRRVALGASVTSIAWAGEQAMFATGAGQVAVEGLDASGPRIDAHDGAILCAFAYLEGHGLLSGGDDGKLNSVSALGAVRTIANFGGKWVDHVVASPASGVIVAGVGKHAVVFSGETEAHRFQFPSSVGGLALDAKGRRLAASHYGGVSLRYALMADDKGVDLRWAGSHLNVTISPGADYLVSSMQENELHGWRLPEKTDLRMSGYAAKTRSFSWDKRGRWLATSGADCAVVWPFVGKLGPQGKAPLTLAPRQALVSAVAFHPNDEILAIGYSDGAAFAVRLTDQTMIELEEPGEGPVTAIAWSGDGMMLAWGDEAGRAAIADLSA